MSGKPASVGAPRAGVPGTPRVLVYVADPRQLEPGAAAPDPPSAAVAAVPPPPPPPPPLDALYLPDNLHHQVALPRNSFYKTHIEQNDQRNQTNAIFYKTLQENGSKYGVYGLNDNIVQTTDFFPQQYMKDACIKIDDRNERHGNNVNVRRDCVDQRSSEFCGVDAFHVRVPVDTLDISTFQTGCTVPSDISIPSMQPVALRHGQNQLSESVTVHSGSEGSNCSDRDLTVGKSYVNYQFLEQSVSHQSIVNQSISILNQQVGVSRGIVSEGESGSAPQLVRTADGVVLAVLPAPAQPHPLDAPEHSSKTTQEFSPQTITVPLGWKRIVSGTSVLYISPSGTALGTLPQLRDYLQTTGTCKCGLPCPLRPETAFSFDSKVISKPYQAASGAELTKLCNHKRKLLATLQARSQSPATPPPQNEQKKVTGTEVAVLKKKMKKRPGFPPNMSGSQLMVQRERPHNEFKMQDHEQNRVVSPGVQQNNNGQPGLAPFPPVQQNQQSINLPNAISQDNDAKQESHVQRSSHYLTVNSGWITQQLENIESMQKANHTSTSTANIGMPVLGANGQVIGVNTGYNKQTTNYKNVTSVMSQNSSNQERKDEKNEMPTQHNVQPVKYSLKEEESQIFCGLNQPLTPEVMQKINEQQQIFIQQNQKQIEMAMKGFRTQLAENVNQTKPQSHNQYVPQGQLVIQNGAVVKTNPAKTPPWQVKRNDSSTSNPMTSPNPKLQKYENTDYDDMNTNLSEDSSSSFSSFSSNEQVINQGICPRVPPLPQHYNTIGQQWQALDSSKKKTKSNTSKGTRKKNSPTENKMITFGSNGMRLMQESKGSLEDMPSNNVPSFMDDPNGYLAQQTVLLNNTISRQVGINSSYDGNQYDSSSNVGHYIPHNQSEKNKPVGKPAEVSNTYRNSVSNPSLSPNTTPDSSVVSDKSMDNSVSQCCKGCNSSMSLKGNNQEYSDNRMRLKYMNHNVYKMELEGNRTAASSPKHSFEESPVTSSTFIERSPRLNDNCGPIQAGTVSTSNVSLTEALQPPEPSPTLSSSSRNTDTPHSGTNSSQMQSNYTYPMASPAYSNSGSCKDNYNSNQPGSSQVYPYSTPGPPNNYSISGTQMMHFISNHNVNKNLMEVDNISMVGVKPGMKASQEVFRLEPRRRIENAMPGYCPPPHLGGGPAHSLIQACYVQTIVTTMASGFSVTRDTVTSVLAGKANTATTSINAAQANFIRPPPPPSVNMATTYAIPNNQPDPFLNSVNLPTSYPLHIAGTTAQNMISKSPLEMVQNVIGSLPSSRTESSNIQSSPLSLMNRRSCQTTPGQILISSTGQIMVSNNHMLPPPKATTTLSPIHGGSSATNVSTSVSHVVPAVGGVQPMVNQPTVVVNTIPSPYVLQPPMMSVDGQVVQQNTVLPQIVTGGMVPGHSPNESSRQFDVKNQSFVQGVTMLSPENLKKRSKKKKNQPSNITNVLQITAPQQNPNNIMVHHSPQHNSSPQFSPRGFQLSPNNISPTPMLQALTIVPGKSGTPAHIVMNGQGNTSNFGSQQIITNNSPSQQINLLQPVNLINNTSSVMSNFPAFQQFIVPNLGGMVMTADGTAIIQDNSTGMSMQLQLQTVNGQSVLTPVQNPGVFTAGTNGGVVIRAQNSQGKIIQSQHSPGAQFLSPNSQVMMNSPNFNGQLSPLLANLSPTNVAFNTSPQMRSGNVQTQEFIQTNQMGQALMVPLSPKQASMAAATNNRSNSTFLHHNTTIVQQQTTLVSNSHNSQMSSITNNLQGGNSSRLSIDPSALLGGKQISHKLRNFAESDRGNEVKVDKHEGGAFDGDGKMEGNEGYAKFMNSFSPGPGVNLGVGMGVGVGVGVGSAAHVRHSVSTQTLVNKSPSGQQAVSGSSPPDTTTHSPLGALEAAASPRLYSSRCLSTQANYADTTTKSPEPADASSSAMVQCVSSSEQDIADSREHTWPTPRNDFNSDSDGHNMISNIPLLRQNRTHDPVESTEIQYGHNMNASSVNSQHVMPMTSNYYERTHTYKRKNDFGDGSSYRSDKIMRTNSYNMIHGLPKETDYDSIGISPPDKSQRHFPQSSSSSDTSALPKVYRHNLGSGDDTKSGEDSDEKSRERAGAEAERAERAVPGSGPAAGATGGAGAARSFRAGEVVWGPVKGHASWPGKLQRLGADGRWAVRWFGAGAGAAPGGVAAARLLTLCEGLEAHHAASTRHRKSRKLNTLLENAIQEAMAELDKESEQVSDELSESLHETTDVTTISETPKRSRKHEKVRGKDRYHKKNTVKLVPNPNKSSDGARLRSSR